MALAIAFALAIPGLQAQSTGTETQSQPPTSPPAQDIPDAPSTVQPPAPKPEPPPPAPSDSKSTKPADNPFGVPGKKPELEEPAPPSATSIGEPPSSAGPRNQVNPKEDLYTFVKTVSFVQIPVTVKYSDGRPFDGLLPKDFTVLENGKKQTLSFFTSDPFQLSVAILLDLGMADVAMQKVHQTYSALVGAFSPYDEVSLYTYSGTVSQVEDFTSRSDKLTAVLNELKLVRGRNNGPPVLGGPMASGPQVNGAPVGGPLIQPVNTPPKEAHVLNDAILRAALDLSKRDKTRRKVIFVISDGRERGSNASYSDVLKLLETRDIQVKAVVLDSGALPGFKQLEKIHLKGQGYGDLLPKYASATGGGQVFTELSRNAMEEAYAQLTSEARNQYTLGYTPKAASGRSAAYRDLEVSVDKAGLKVYAKTGYYPIPSVR
jgi:VWFA-related protein